MLWLVAVSFSNTAPAEGPILLVLNEQEQLNALLTASAPGGTASKAALAPDTDTATVRIVLKSPGPTPGRRARMRTCMTMANPRFLRVSRTPSVFYYRLRSETSRLGKTRVRYATRKALRGSNRIRHILSVAA